MCDTVDSGTQVAIHELGNRDGEDQGWREDIKQGCSRFVRSCCTVKTAKTRLPILTWLPTYRLAWLFRDFVAGFTVGLTVIPQGLAYAALAELPLQYGLYSAFMGCFVYCVFGGSRHVTLGPTAITTLMVAEYVNGEPVYAVVLCLLAGCVQFLMGVLHLGFLVNFISFPVLAGFSSAAAITIATSQVKLVLGLKNIPRSFIKAVPTIFQKITHTNLSDMGMGIVCFVVLIVLKKLKEVDWDKKKGTLQKPPLWQKILRKVLWLFGTVRNAVVVVAASVVAYGLLTRGISTFTLTKEIKPGLPAFQPPQFWLVKNGTVVKNGPEIIQDIGVGLVIVPLIGFLESIAIGKAFARKGNYRIDATQELIAIGVTNMLGSFVSAYPVTGSFGRTAVNYQSGVKTQLGGLFTGILVILALAFLTPSFKYIPSAALGAVIISAVIQMVEYSVIPVFWRVKKLDLLAFFVTFFGVLLLGIQYGIALGVGVSLIILLYPSARPRATVYPASIAPDDVLIVQLESGLNFPAVDYMRDVVAKDAFKEKPYKNVVMRCCCVSDIDCTVVQALDQLIEEFEARGLKLHFSCMRPDIRAALVRSKIKGFRYFKTCEDAIAAMREPDQENGEVIMTDHALLSNIDTPNDDTPDNTPDNVPCTIHIPAVNVSKVTAV
uniref:Sodium-independent sulfate anion transporter n=1 Tax=Branchiostoma floridae TaxID=7739 RepID=C3Z715_BRAFL|eukprot:XP_002595599.1 hypothetical protein BRAFLDRAFT_64709 [Branchiostoma floridae]